MALNITRTREAKPTAASSNGVSPHPAASQERETALIDSTSTEPLALAPEAQGESPEGIEVLAAEADAPRKPRRSRRRSAARKTADADAATEMSDESDAPPAVSVEPPAADAPDADVDAEAAPKKPASRRRSSRARATAEAQSETAVDPIVEAVPATPAGFAEAIQAQSRLIERQIAIAERQLRQLEQLNNRLDRQHQQLDQQARKLDVQTARLDAESKQIEKLSASVEATLRKAGEAVTETRPKVGVFVDVANVELAADRFRDRLDWKKVLALLTKDRELVRAVAYAPIHSDLDVSIESQRFVEPFLDSDFKIITKPLKKFQDGTVKANVDIEMAVDILGMLDRLDVVCLVSGDGDFRPLVEVCQSRGIRVEVVGVGPTVARQLRDAADRFIDLQERLREIRK